MNSIRAISKLSEQELEQNVPFSASWHQQYNDTAYVFFSGVPFELTEGDVLVVFSQYGVPVHLRLVRDKETGKSRGFGWLKYEDQRSTVLAVDNLNGIKLLGRVIKVDHAKYEEKERDEEYEKMLNDELKNDFADDVDENEGKEKEKEKPENDEFADPLLLMKSSEKKDRHKRHRSRSGERKRHKSGSHRRHHDHHDDDNNDQESKRSHRHSSSTHKNDDKDATH